MSARGCLCCVRLHWILCQEGLGRQVLEGRKAHHLFSVNVDEWRNPLPLICDKLSRFSMTKSPPKPTNQSYNTHSGQGEGQGKVDVHKSILTRQNKWTKKYEWWNINSNSISSRQGEEHASLMFNYSGYAHSVVNVPSTALHRCAPTGFWEAGIKLFHWTVTSYNSLKITTVSTTKNNIFLHCTQGPCY